MSTTKTPKSYWIKIAIVLAIQIFFRFIPPIGNITSLGMAVAGIFIGTLVGWCLCDAIWPSLSCIVLLGLTEYGTPTGLVSSMFGNAAVLTGLLSFLFGGCVVATGLSDWATRWLMSRKILNGRPILIVAFLLLAMWILTPYCGIAVLILLWEMTVSIAKQAGIDRDNNRWMTIVVFALFFISGVGFYFNWNPGVLSCMGVATAVNPDYVLNAMPFAVYGSVTSLLLVIVNTVVLFLIYRPDLKPLKAVKLEECPPITKPVIASLLLILRLLIMTLVPSLLPACAVKTWLSKFGTIGTLCICIAISLVIRFDGQPMVTMRKAADVGLNWAPIFIMGTALLVAGALTSEDTGVVTTIKDTLTPMFSGMSPFAFAAVIILCCIILTNFLNNIVVATIFIPIIASMADVIGINAMALIVTSIYACYVAVLLPSANPMTALVFGKGDIIKTSDIFHYAPIVMVVSYILLIFISYPLACALY